MQSLVIHAVHKQTNTYFTCLQMRVVLNKLLQNKLAHGLEFITYSVISMTQVRRDDYWREIPMTRALQRIGILYLDYF